MVNEQNLDWRNESLGGRVRVALWLFYKIGEGNQFSKQELRNDIPGVEQIDRRMRDLRPAGWIIRNYKDMASLSPDMLYLEKVGAHVWEPGQRSAGLRKISGLVRRQVMDRDEYRCLRCGIGAGEEYPNELGTRARLTLGHVNPHKYGSGSDMEDLVTECARCNETAKHLTGLQFDADRVWDLVQELGKKEKMQLLAWMVSGSRSLSRTERAWMKYRQLPAVSRDEVRRRLGATLGASKGEGAF